jgi:hypothetical protein
MAGETTYQCIEGTGENLRFYDTGSGLLPEYILYDQSGNPLGTQANPLRISPGSGGTPNAAASVTVGTSSTSVLAANSSRKLLVLCNDSVNTIYVDLSGGTAATSKGVRLNASGGSILLDHYVPTSAITAIASAASSVLTIQEG